MTRLHAVGSEPPARGPARRSRGGSGLTVRAEAPGKVNLLLSVGAPGEDGYHPLTTVFQAVRLIETVTARAQAADRRGDITLALTAPDASVPLDERNLAFRAAALLAERTEVCDGVDLTIRKRVPVAGGMAGGSADAAATLVACNSLWGTGLTHAELAGVAGRLGADVPFLLTGATAAGHGRGDLVTPLMGRGTYSWVLALQDEGLSTPAVFRRFDEMCAADRRRPETRPVPGTMATALRSGDAVMLAATLANDLEPAAIDLRPELAAVIATAEAHGALKAIVSGSGPTVAALVRDEADAQLVASALEVSGVCSRVLRTTGPVPGARVVG